jgi:hypothetical protein
LNSRRRVNSTVSWLLPVTYMGPLFSLIFGAILGCIFLVVCGALFIYGRRTGNWRALKFAGGTGALIFLLVAISIGSELFFFLRLTRDQPQIASLMGTWKQTEFTSYPAQITLQSDGTFNSSSASESLSGHWELSKQGDIWSITLHSEKWMGFGLVGRSAPYRLYTYVGDPDSNEMVIYTKADR